MRILLNESEIINEKGKKNAHNNKKHKTKKNKKNQKNQKNQQNQQNNQGQQVKDDTQLYEDYLKARVKDGILRIDAEEFKSFKEITLLSEEQLDQVDKKILFNEYTNYEEWWLLDENKYKNWVPVMGKNKQLVTPKKFANNLKEEHSVRPVLRFDNFLNNPAYSDLGEITSFIFSRLIFDIFSSGSELLLISRQLLKDCRYYDNAKNNIIDQALNNAIKDALQAATQSINFSAYKEKVTGSGNTNNTNNSDKNKEETSTEDNNKETFNPSFEDITVDSILASIENETFWSSQFDDDVNNLTKKNILDYLKAVYVKFAENGTLEDLKRKYCDKILRQCQDFGVDSVTLEKVQIAIEWMRADFEVDDEWQKVLSANFNLKPVDLESFVPEVAKKQQQPEKTESYNRKNKRSKNEDKYSSRFWELYQER